MKSNSKKITILITGASDGIGKAIALRLAKDGHKLLLCGRDKERLQGVANQCGEGAQIFVFNINDHDARNAELEKIENLDVLINNAGIWQKLGELETVSDQDIMDIINTNLTSQIILTKKLLPLIKSSKGTIVNIISKSGIAAQAGQSVYTASKYGMRGFTEVLREDVKKEGVRVLGVYQSGTNTQMFSKAGDNLPVEEFTEPEDLADLVAYMINSPDKLIIQDVRVDKDSNR